MTLTARANGLSPNALGSMYMVIGSLGYVINDALVRLATEDGLDVYQTLCLRGMAMTALFAAAVRSRGERIERRQLGGPLLTRVAAELSGTALFFAALIELEFANAQTILLLVPFAVTLVASLRLGESVSPRHYLAVIAGFLGVVLVVQPATDGFSWWSLAVLGAAACLTVREIATKRIPNTIPATTIALLTAIGLTVLTGAIAIVTGWNEITMKRLLLVFAACLCLVIGYLFTIQTVRVGDLSVSAPFRYTTLLGAVVLGYVFFGEVPNTLTIVGCSVIVLAGVYAIRLDRPQRRRAS